MWFSCLGYVNFSVIFRVPNIPYIHIQSNLSVLLFLEGKEVRGRKGRNAS